jgi:hypothetical protein
MACCKEMKKKIKKGTISKYGHIHASTGGPFDHDQYDDFTCKFCPFCGVKLK